MVRPIFEYGSSVWDPHPDKLKKELEKVQNRAARFVTRNYDYETGSMTGILGQLKWESLKKRRKDNRLILLYKGLKGKAKIPTDDLIPKTRHDRNQHSLAFQIPSASKDVYMYSFFPQTIRDWNDLPESLISSSELSDDSVSKFTSLVRATLLTPYFGNHLFANYRVLKHQLTNLILSSFYIPKVLKSVAKIMEIGSQIKI